jgi:hypothetical protein
MTFPQLGPPWASLFDDMRRRAPAKIMAAAVSCAALSAVLWGLLCLVAARAAFAGPFDLGGRDWEGCADLVDMAKSELGAARVVPTSRLDLRDLKREDGVILLHPERSLDVESLSRFMRAGGRVILLDDFGTGDALLQHFGMQRVPLPAHPAEALRGNPALAIAEPASPPHPVVNDVTRVVTNHATGLKHPDLSPVLKVRADHQAAGHGGDADVPVAVAGAVGQGRLLVVGDPSIVMNSMLRYPGNKAFARGLFKYAADDDTWGKRGGRVFIATGDFEQKGAFGDESAMGSEWSERMRALKDALQTLRKEGMSAGAAYVLAVAVGFGVVVWVGSRAGRLHRPSVPRFTRRIPLAAQGGVAGHAAVIAAPHTSRVLALLELKSALEEDLCKTLGLENNPGHEALLGIIASRRLLDAEGYTSLKALLLRMAGVETMVLSQRASALQPIRDREVLAVARTVKHILSAVHESARAYAGPLGPLANPDVTNPDLNRLDVKTEVVGRA